LLNDQWVNDEIKEEIKRFLDTAKTVLRGKLIAMSVHIKRIERSQIDDLKLHLKLLEKQEQANPKTSRRREIIKIRAKINEIETITKKIQRINETKNWFFEKMNKINRSLKNLTKMRIEKPKSVKSEMQKGR
jgi:alpha/beta superfamily hydrolase